jgi:hypothetical protein
MLLYLSKKLENVGCKIDTVLMVVCNLPEVVLYPVKSQVFNMGPSDFYLFMSLMKHMTA